MGSFSEIAFAFSSLGWQQMRHEFSLLSQEDCDMIRDLIREADISLVANNGDRLVYFESVKSSADDMQKFVQLINMIDHDEYLVVDINEYGEEETGGYYDNSFGINVVKSIAMDQGGTVTMDPNDIIGKIPTVPITSNPVGVMNTAPFAAKPVIQTPVVNDHVCGVCGNTKVSKAEKSCWKCGSPL